MKNLIRCLSALSFMFALVGYWSLNSMRLPSIEDDVQANPDISRLIAALQRRGEFWTFVRDKQAERVSWKNL